MNSAEQEKQQRREPPSIGIRLCSEASEGRGQLIRAIPGYCCTQTSNDLLSTFPLETSLSAIFRDATRISFLSPQGCVVSETTVVSEILNKDNTINICIKHKEPKLGISIHCEAGVNIQSDSILNYSSQVKGFVYCPFNSSLDAFVEKIHDQLPDLYEALSKFDYIFLDQNSWPISKKQESALTVVEVCISSCVHISLLRSKKQDNAVKDVIFQEESERTSLHCAHQVTSNPCLPEQSNISSWKALQYGADAADNNSFEILLSYVHAEADQYASLLKTALEDKGFSVFLDVHCIKGGEDWQDVLNNAISNCSLFIPLITSKYGQTLWTNREVKLADVLGKLILPINFNLQWPPQCLAIQFATTQYIPGNTSSSLTSKSFTEDIASKLAREVAGKYKKEETSIPSESDIADVMPTASRVAFDGMSSSSSSDSLSSTTYRKSKIKSYAASLPKSIPKSFRESAHESKEGTPLMVISCSSEQSKFAKTVMAEIQKKGYDAWCACEAASKSEEQRSAEFQDKVNEAGAVLFVLSTDFAEDMFCQQQVYYCEQRKRILSVIYEPFEMPDWMSTLIGSSPFIDYQSSNYLSTLLHRIDIMLDSSKARLESKRLQQQEEELGSLYSDIKNKLPEGKRVYVCGGSKFFSKNGRSICREVGRQLAKIKDLILVTGGFYGVGETVGRSFLEERDRMQAPHNVCHIVAVRDDQDQSSLTRQNSDRTFAKVPYGDTLFYGNSVRQREMLTARVIDLCVLMEGGPGASFVVQQYAWNGNQVIPVAATGGAASGLFNAPASIFKCPAQVSTSDWSTLRDASASAAEIASAVCRIVTTLIHSKT